MIKAGIIGRGVVTPVGNTPQAAFQAAREGRSALRLHAAQEPFFASLLDRGGYDGPSFFEEIALAAARQAVAEAGINPSAPSCALLLSSIKGNVERLGREDVSLAASARRLALALGVKTAPVVVSNACISGLAALVLGLRMIHAGLYRHVIVVGAEVQSPFIVSGFQSLKALSPEACRPFDKDRQGLNLGEAAAAVVLGADEGDWFPEAGAIRNDANHISGPSRTGEGSFQALRAVLTPERREALAFVNVHGTATLYNDQMEALALERTGLLDVPVNALKGVFGHTMGAAGILESLLSMQALEAGVVLPTRGFSALGVSAPVQVSAQERPVHGNAFIKLLSGFGGVNGALYFRKGGAL